VPRSPDDREATSRGLLESEAARFCVRFAVLTAVSFTALSLITDDELGPYLTALAVATAHGLALLGMDVTREGTLVSALGFTVRVEGQCSALYETALLSAAILASPFPIWRKLLGILVGTGAILAANLVRIASLVVIGALAPRYFTGAHLFVWQAILVALIASFWLVWIDRAREATAG
jgi:exosortase/archaeosortase family protein